MWIRGLIVGLGIVALGSCTRESNAEVSAEAVVRASLRDPDSAKFSDVTAHRSPVGTGASPAPIQVCGTVNSRNGFGGYVGPRRFIVTDGTGVAIIDPAGDGGNEVFEALWASHCIK